MKYAIIVLLLMSSCMDEPFKKLNDKINNNRDHYKASVYKDSFIEFKHHGNYSVEIAKFDGNDVISYKLIIDDILAPGPWLDFGVVVFKDSKVNKVSFLDDEIIKSLDGLAEFVTEIALSDSTKKYDVIISNKEIKEDFIKLNVTSFYKDTKKEYLKGQLKVLRKKYLTVVHRFDSVIDDEIDKYYLSFVNSIK